MIKILSTVFLFILLQACTPAKPDIDVKDAYPFSAVRSYALMSRDDLQDNESLISDALRNRIELAIEAQMDAKGFQNVARDKADVRVAYRVITRPNRPPSKAGRAEIPCRSCSQESQSNFKRRQFDEGTLIIQMIDRKTGKSVWRAVAPGSINPKADMDDRKEQVNKAVAFLLENFPPK